MVILNFFVFFLYDFLNSFLRFCNFVDLWVFVNLIFFVWSFFFVKLLWRDEVICRIDLFRELRLGGFFKVGKFLIYFFVIDLWWIRLINLLLVIFDFILSIKILLFKLEKLSVFIGCLRFFFNLEVGRGIGVFFLKFVLCFIIISFLFFFEFFLFERVFDLVFMICGLRIFRNFCFGGGSWGSGLLILL